MAKHEKMGGHNYEGKSGHMARKEHEPKKLAHGGGKKGSGFMVTPMHKNLAK
ncbi:MAG TPA: hypothetical protein VKQ11_00495 [Candidatus Sulfotelmatobacter sp.]|nr:hypothetical protein [Candidatus Sulfotelmatobacter sp.]